MWAEDDHFAMVEVRRVFWLSFAWVCPRWSAQPLSRTEQRRRVPEVVVLKLNRRRMHASEENERLLAAQLKIALSDLMIDWPKACERASERLIACTYYT